MPTLELPPNPAQPPAHSGDTSASSNTTSVQPIKVRIGRRGEVEEHELIHMLDSIDDELSKARFRESIYISTIVCLAIAWFLFYGPRVLFHQPDYKDFVTVMKERDKQITYVEAPPTVAPRPPARSTPDSNTLQRLRQQPPRAAAPAPPQTTEAPPPPQQARTTAPPVVQPTLPLPSAPTPSRSTQNLPDAPHPTIAQNAPSETARDAMRDAVRGARNGPGGDINTPSPGSSGPLQAGGQILSDTMGVDFSAYMRRLEHDIKRNWEPLIPEEVQAPLLKNGIVGIRFSILPDGSIANPMTLETRSGDVALDKAAWYAITTEKQFPALPKEFHGPRLELRIGFFYNEPIEK